MIDFVKKLFSRIDDDKQTKYLIWEYKGEKPVRLVKVYATREEAIEYLEHLFI